MAKLEEGETKTTDLPVGGQLVEKLQFGVHTLAVYNLGVEKAKVDVKRYPAWNVAFDAVMDKAGL